MASFHKGHRLTHLNSWEARLWSKWLDIHIDEYFGYTYDVHVGTPTKVPHDWPAWVKRDAAALSMKRIDVVMEDTSNIYVVEVKERASLACLGRLLSYRYLYLETFNPGKPVQLVLVTDKPDPDLLPILDSLGVRLFVV